MNLFHAIILAIVEGITEFLPVSSTGHMIIASSLMGIADNPFTKTFTVSIQFGAILSVVALYFKRFFQSIDFYMKLAVAFLPAAVIGFLLDDYIDMLLGNVIAVAVMLVLGGIILVYIDRWLDSEHGPEGETVTYRKALKIGFFQCIAMFPGVSRSAASIIGGMMQKLNRTTAAEFSFFLAVPTMFAATVFKIYKFYDQGIGIQEGQAGLLLIGNLVAFVVAMIAIRSFITYLTRHGFKIFGYYRILVGLLILILYYSGVELQLLD